MLCNKVSMRLSEFFDGVLDAGMSVRVSKHLKQCENCRKELQKLSILHGRLKSMEEIHAPDYLYHLVQNRLTDKKKNTWRNQFRDALSYQWSRIRTTNSQFYCTRALGTVVAVLCFCFIIIFSNMDYPGFHSQAETRSANYNEYIQEFLVTFRKQWGHLPYEQLGNYGQIMPEIDAQSLTTIGTRHEESVTDTIENSNVAVLAVVDSSGTGKVDSVLESSNNLDFLSSMNSVIASANYRPGRLKGRSVTSPLVLLFHRIVVFCEE